MITKQTKNIILNFFLNHSIIHRLLRQSILSCPQLFILAFFLCFFFGHKRIKEIVISLQLHLVPGFKSNDCVF